MRWWWARHDQSGATATEFVVIFPLFMILVLGTFSVGVAFYRQLNLTQAAREGVRYAATLPTGYHPDPAIADTDISGVPTNEWLEAAVTRATAAATGQWQLACVAYTGPVGRDDAEDTGATTTRAVTRDGDGTDTFTNDTCFDDDRGPDERRVQVRIEADSWFNAFAFGTNLRLGGRAVARFESVYPIDQTP